LTGEIDDGAYIPKNLSVVSGGDADRTNSKTAGARSLDNPASAADPVARLRQMISERQEESVEILRGWMEDTEEESV
jgi:flagellar M-ring protein FliF